MSCSRCPKSSVSARTIVAMVALALGVFVAERATAERHTPAATVPSP